MTLLHNMALRAFARHKTKGSVAEIKQKQIINNFTPADQSARTTLMQKSETTPHIHFSHAGIGWSNLSFALKPYLHVGVVGSATHRAVSRESDDFVAQIQAPAGRREFDIFLFNGIVGLRENNNEFSVT